MQKLLVAATVAALTATTVAQTTFTTPSGYDTKTSGSTATNLALSYASAGYTVAHFQVTDSTMPKGKATLTQMEWRTNTSLTYSTSRGMARTINSLQLQLGYVAKTMTRTFSTNWSGAATTVFSSKSFSLPGYTTGTPTQAWGNVAKFPISKFMWDSSKGTMLQDWQHAGGTLANSATFSSTYYLDGPGSGGVGTSSLLVSPSSTSTAASRYVPQYYRTAPICNDSALTSTTSGAYGYYSFYVYSDNFSTASRRGMSRVSSASGSYIAPAAPVIAMLSWGGSDTGSAAGALCNKLHVNTSFPLAIIAKTSGTSTFSGYTSFTGTGGLSTSALLPWDDMWAGQSVYWQVAWDDSVKKAFSLSVATKLVLPKKPLFTPKTTPGEYVRKYIRKGSTSPVLSGPFSSAFYNPTERWTKL